MVNQLSFACLRIAVAVAHAHVCRTSNHGTHDADLERMLILPPSDEASYALTRRQADPSRSIDIESSCSIISLKSSCDGQQHSKATWIAAELCE